MQRRLGITWFIGAILSAGFASPALVVASTAAFLLSEFADLAVYTPLQRRRFMRAVIASSVVSLVVDSMLFLWLVSA
ncbi:VUT family protein [Mesorhizobium sp. M0482]|uniref:VUT family protein n=1 Tax=Mesorhizobium sp. M0482 TaxID=2956948 RepID=UPI00333C7381